MKTTERIIWISLAVWIIVCSAFAINMLCSHETFAAVFGLIALVFAWLIPSASPMFFISAANILYLFSFFTLRRIKNSHSHKKLRIASIGASYIAFIFGLVALLRFSSGEFNLPGAIGYLSWLLSFSLMAHAETKFYYLARKEGEEEEEEPDDEVIE